MRTALVALVSALGLIVATPAEAWMIQGNPKLNFRVDRPQGDYLDGSVVLNKVRIHDCANNPTDYPVDDTVDPVAGVTLNIDPGDLCQVTFFWDTAISVNGPLYTVEKDEVTTSLEIEEDMPPVLLSDCEVVSGTMLGGCPWLMVSVTE